MHYILSILDKKFYIAQSQSMHIVKHYHSLNHPQTQHTHTKSEWSHTRSIVRNNHTLWLTDSVTQFLLFFFFGLGKLRGIFRTAVHEAVGCRAREEEEAEAAPESTSSASSNFLFTAVFVTTQPRALKWSITLTVTIKTVIRSKYNTIAITKR